MGFRSSMEIHMLLSWIPYLGNAISRLLFVGDSWVMSWQFVDSLHIEQFKSLV